MSQSEYNCVPFFSLPCFCVFPCVVSVHTYDASTRRKRFPFVLLIRCTYAYVTRVNQPLVAKGDTDLLKSLLRLVADIIFCFLNRPCHPLTCIPRSWTFDPLRWQHSQWHWREHAFVQWWETFIEIRSVGQIYLTRHTWRQYYKLVSCTDSLRFFNQ